MWLGSPPNPTTSHHKIESTNLIQWGCLWPFIESCREGFFRQNQSIDEDNSGWLSETRVANWLRSDPKTPDQSISSRLEGDFWCQTFFLIFVYNAQKKLLRTKCFAWSFSQFWNTNIPSLPNKTFPHLSDSPKLCHAFALESYLRQKMWLGSLPNPTTRHHTIHQWFLSTGDTCGPHWSLQAVSSKLRCSWR